MSENATKIRNILKEHGRLTKDALALEGEFDVEFPDHMLKRSVFESISAITTAIDELTASR